MAEDVSLEARLATQANYLRLIQQRPFLGHGFGSDIYYRETGRIWLSAHSQALTSAFEYGVFYPVVLCLVTASLHRWRSRIAVERALATNSVAQFVAASVVLFAYASVTHARVFYVALGMICALVQYPNLSLEYAEKIGRPGATPGHKTPRTQPRRPNSVAHLPPPPSRHTLDVQTPATEGTL